MGLGEDAERRPREYWNASWRILAEVGSPRYLKASDLLAAPSWTVRKGGNDLEE